MANERKTVVTVRGDGIQKTYAFHMDYLKKSFIKVKLDGTAMTYGVDFTVNSKQVDFVITPAPNVIIVIYRETSTSKLVSWEDASVLRAQDMTVFETQLLHLAEETSDKVQDSGMAKDDFDGVWDARYERIKNVQDPIDNLDVVTKKYFESIHTGYIQENQALVNEAVMQKNIATTKANEAAASATTASTKAAEAATAALSASSSATTSTIKATAANISAMDAASLAATASTKAALATSEADRAKGEVNRAEALLTGHTVIVPTFPIGAPFPWFSSMRPDGTLLCDGSSFSLSAYPKLALVYPSGVLPDMRGLVVRGLDRGRGLDVDGAGRVLGSYQGDEFMSHTHSIHNHANDNLNGGAYSMQSAHMYSQTSWSTGASGGSETRMKNIACDWLVYATTLEYDLTINNGNAVTLGGYPANHFTDKGYVDNLVGNRVWVSEPQTLVNGVPLSISHGLVFEDISKVHVDYVLFCKTPNNGYVYGDWVFNTGSSNSGSGTYHLPLMPVLSDTTVGLISPSNMIIRHKTTGVIVGVTLTGNWDVALRIRY